MELFETMHNKGHEQVVFFNHDGTGLKAIVAIHDTTLPTPCTAKLSRPGSS